MKTFFSSLFHLNFQVIYPVKVVSLDYSKSPKIETQLKDTFQLLKPARNLRFCSFFSSTCCLHSQHSYLGYVSLG